MPLSFSIVAIPISASKCHVLSELLSSAEGSWHRLLIGSVAVGIDLSCAMLRVARRQLKNAPVAVADLQASLPFGNCAFDAVLCALIGEHLSELRVVFDEFYRILKRGGRLVFSVYHPEMSAAKYLGYPVLLVVTAHKDHLAAV